MLGWHDVEAFAVPPAEWGCIMQAWGRHGVYRNCRMGCRSKYRRLRNTKFGHLLDGSLTVVLATHIAKSKFAVAILVSFVQCTYFWSTGGADVCTMASVTACTGNIIAAATQHVGDSWTREKFLYNASLWRQNREGRACFFAVVGVKRSDRECVVYYLYDFKTGRVLVILAH